jgi:hypothetical protein
MLVDATVKAFHYKDLESLKAHVLASSPLATSPSTSKPCAREHPSRSKTPGQAPVSFKINPHHLIPRPNT